MMIDLDDIWSMKYKPKFAPNVIDKLAESIDTNRLGDQEYVNGHLVYCFDLIKDDHFQGGLELNEAHEKVMELCKAWLPEREFNKLRHRVDNRDIFGFFKDISKRTTVETTTIKDFIEKVKAAGVDAEYSDTGCDNEGKPIFWGKKVNSLDFDFSYKGKSYPLDVKNNPFTSEFNTYKVEDFARGRDGGVLLTKNKSGQYILFPPKVIDKVAKLTEAYTFKWNRFGYKKCVRFLTAGLDKAGMVVTDFSNLPLELDVDQKTIEKLAADGVVHFNK